MSFLIYFVGIGALFLCDILITRSFPPETIALWAETRALIGVVGVLVTLGLDMVFVRSPQSSGRLLKLVLVQTPVLAVGVGFGVHAVGYLSSYTSAILLALGASLNMVQGQYFRAHNCLVESQIIQQGWKITVLVGIAAAVFYPGQEMNSPDLLAASLLVGLAGLGWILILRKHPTTTIAQGPEPIRDIYSISSRFLLMSLVLTLANYGEQLMVNGLGTVEAAAVYFTHATYFLFPVSIVTGYLGFRISPWLRDNHERFVKLLSTLRTLKFFIIVVYVAVMHVAGLIGWRIVSPIMGDPDLLLQAILFISAVARTFYVIPSGYNGVFGRPSQHDVLILSQVALLTVIGALIFVFLGRVELVYLIASLGALNWAARTIIASQVMKGIIKSHGHQALNIRP